MLYMVFLYVVLAESWNIIGGFTGYLSFGHVAFFGLGAYTTGFLMNKLALSPIATILSSIPGGFIAALVAFLIGYPCLRLRGPYFAVVTLCFAFVVHMVVQNIDLLGGVEGLWLAAMKQPIHVIRGIFYELMLALMVTVILFVRWMEGAKLGRGLVTIREDEEVAQTLGIHTPRMKVLAFALSAFFPGVAGGRSLMCGGDYWRLAWTSSTSSCSRAVRSAMISSRPSRKRWLCITRPLCTAAHSRS